MVQFTFSILVNPKNTESSRFVRIACRCLVTVSTNQLTELSYKGPVAPGLLETDASNVAYVQFCFLGETDEIQGTKGTSSMLCVWCSTFCPTPSHHPSNPLLPDDTHQTALVPQLGPFLREPHHIPRQ